MDTIENPDGTETPNDATPGTAFVRLPALGDAVRQLVVDPLLLAQIAAAKIVGGLPVHILDAGALVEGRHVVAATKRISRVTIDRPKSEEDLAPLSVCIVEGSPTRQADDLPSAHFNDEAQDSCCLEEDGVVVEYVTEFDLELDIYTVATHNDERRGMRAALINAFVAEPRLESLGRSVAIEGTPYLVTFSFTEMSNAPEEPQTNIREAVLRVAATVPLLRLTRATPRMTIKPLATLE